MLKKEIYKRLSLAFSEQAESAGLTYPEFAFMLAVNLEIGKKVCEEAGIIEELNELLEQANELIENTP